MGVICTNLANELGHHLVGSPNPATVFDGEIRQEPPRDPDPSAFPHLHLLVRM